MQQSPHSTEKSFSLYLIKLTAFPLELNTSSAQTCPCYSSDTLNARLHVQISFPPNNPIATLWDISTDCRVAIHSQSINPHLVPLLTSPSILLILTSSLRISKAPWIRSSRFIPFSLAKVSSKPFSASSYVCLGEKKKISVITQKQSLWKWSSTASHELLMFWIFQE